VNSPCRAVFAALLVVGTQAPILAAQGVSTAAIYGRVQRAAAGAIADVSVTATNMATGERWRTRTRADGSYVFEYLSLAGAYVVEARMIGYSAVSATVTALGLGERRRMDLSLAPLAQRLDTIAVSGRIDALVNSGRTGPAQTIGDSLVSRIPVQHRDFSQLVFLSPQAVQTASGGVSIAGQSDRLNGFQIDGATNLDLIGFAGGEGFGTPAASSGVRTLSVEALKELQILTAPFDVRYGTFAGGLVNAVTHSGTNSWTGSVTSFLETRQLTGKDSTGARAQDFRTSEVNVAIGGPIIRDRLAFFVNAGLHGEVVPQNVPGIGSDTTGGADSVGIGVRYASAVRFRDILRSQYGLDAGGFASAPTRLASGNLFAKFTFQAGMNSRVELSHNFARGSPSSPGFRSPDEQYALTSNGDAAPGVVNATRLNWTRATDNGWTNELSVARLNVRERCETPSHSPQVFAFADASALVAGDTEFCTVNYSNQNTWELTDNLSWFRGAHRFTVGTHSEFIRAARITQNIPLGRWSFAGLDELQAGTPEQYDRTIANPLQPEGQNPDFGVNQVGLYAQDQFTVTNALTLTAGLRVDVPYLTEAPRRNNQLLASLGIDNSRTPSGNAQWAPRLGLSYDLGSRGFLRGGIGIFGGRPAYHWLLTAGRANGLDLLTLTCTGASVPAFTLDAVNQPSTCGGTITGPTTEVVYFNPKFRFPRNLRTSLGADVRLPAGIVGTVDALFVRGVDQFYLNDVNLVETGVLSGEGGRVMYGALAPANANATTSRVNAAFGPVIEVRNADGDAAFVFTLQLQKRFAAGAELGAAYTRTDSRDRMSAGADLAQLNVGGANLLDGTWAQRRLAPSAYSVPNKLALTGAMDLPARLRVALVYIYQTGTPYAYRVGRDINADGITFGGSALGNDLVYVPRDSADIALVTPSEWATLNQFIQSEPCLSRQGGQVMHRNSCRNPSVAVMNARLTKVVPATRGRTIEVIADVFNVMNLLNSDWGIRRRVSGVRLLDLVSFDGPGQRGVYRVRSASIDRRLRDVEASRWRSQLGLRFAF
jgi:hypothetical protein